MYNVVSLVCILEFHLCLLKEGGCSELVIYCILHINQVISNSASSAILHILTNHSPVLEGTHYVYKYMHTVLTQIYRHTKMYADLYIILYISV